LSGFGLTVAPIQASDPVKEGLSPKGRLPLVCDDPNLGHERFDADRSPMLEIAEVMAPFLPSLAQSSGRLERVPVTFHNTHPRFCNHSTAFTSSEIPDIKFHAQT